MLFAFQVTEWANERGNRKAEKNAIERLITEYEQNLEILNDDKLKTQSTLDASVKLLSFAAPEPVPNMTDASVAQLLMECLTNAKFIPNLGATNSITTSGDLALIQDLDIQRQLSAWQSELRVLNEWQDIERINGEELIFVYTTQYIAWPNVSHSLGRFETKSQNQSDYTGLFSSKQFEGLLFNRWVNTRDNLKMMEDLESETHELLDLLRTRYEELN